MEQVLQAGASVRLIINGITLGFATGLSFTRSTASKYIYGIDSPYAQEIVNTTYSVGGTLTGVRVRASGGLDGFGIMDLSTLQSYFNQKYCTLEIVDRSSNKTMYTIQKVVFDQDSWTIQARSIITFSGNFKGVFVSNEVSDKS